MIDTFSIENGLIRWNQLWRVRTSGTFANSHSSGDRRSFIGGSDARIIMGDDEAALLRLWREKRGEVEPEDLSETSLSSSAP